MSDPTTTVTVSIDLVQLIGALGGVAGAMLAALYGFGRLLVRQIEKRLDERFTTRDKSIEEIKTQISKVETHGRTLESDILRLRAELPNEYVRREDWIRFSGTIDAKLDWLREKSEATGNLVAKVMERLKKHSGSTEP
ncbi:MAG TPA: hypothetical protein VFS24_06335 [Steroidobacteraceae bacterium]|nr:hypothetical protein [Steroidobacteraceae bacterium]